MTQAAPNSEWRPAAASIHHGLAQRMSVSILPHLETRLDALCAVLVLISKRQQVFIATLRRLRPGGTAGTVLVPAQRRRRLCHRHVENSSLQAGQEPRLHRGTKLPTAQRAARGVEQLLSLQSRRRPLYL